MSQEYKASIIVPAYNSENTIEECLKSICLEANNFVSEIIVIDDNSNDKTSDIVKDFKEIKLIKLEKNMGVGHVRNLGAKMAKYETLCYVDSDLVIGPNSILNLLKKLYENEKIGSVSAIQDVANLNIKSWSSNFVCLKSCYGFDKIKKELEFSACASEFCVINKKVLSQIGGWKSLRRAGGEEFDLGYKINLSGKKNIKIRNASYKAFYASLYSRFIKIIDRTEKYIHIFLLKKKFDTPGSFATSNQALSCFFTFLILLTLLFSLILIKFSLLPVLIILFIAQLIVEGKFLLFAKKHFGFKMLFFSLLGIQIINIGILIGAGYFFLKLFNFKEKTL
tara:strand:- start:3033 stop:4043 length:1011 start_codon:yes stop_codon:yes gene_type:complete